MLHILISAATQYQKKLLNSFPFLNNCTSSHWVSFSVWSYMLMKEPEKFKSVDWPGWLLLLQRIRKWCLWLCYQAPIHFTIWRYRQGNYCIWTNHISCCLVIQDCFGDIDKEINYCISNYELPAAIISLGSLLLSRGCQFNL